MAASSPLGRQCWPRLRLRAQLGQPAVEFPEVLLRTGSATEDTRAAAGATELQHLGDGVVTQTLA